MKKGLIMEGGGLRGLFTGGVIDVLMENGIVFDGAVGVSAGAVFGCNYKSEQIGRPLRYNKKYCKDPRYGSFKSWLKTGNIFDVDFCYDELPNKLDLFDVEAYEKNPMEFYVVCTDVETGKPVYHKCMKGDADDIKWMRASASIPMLSKIVRIDDYKLLDGGISDSIPLRFFQSEGYDRNVVILTRPKDYIKKKSKMYIPAKLSLHGYPNMVKAMMSRHVMYNETTEYIKQSELAGDTLVIRPQRALDISNTETNPDEIERIYQIGRHEAEKMLPKIIEFLK